MQQFKKKLKNASKDTPQVLCSANSQLNKEETLSVESALAEQMGSTITDKAIKYEIEDVSDEALKKEGLFMPYCKGGNA